MIVHGGTAYGLKNLKSLFKTLLSNTGVSNLLYMYTQGYILSIRRGTFKVSNRRWKYIYILFISKYVHIYQLILLSNVIICLLLNISMNNHDKVCCHKKF